MATTSITSEQAAEVGTRSVSTGTTSPFDVEQFGPGWRSSSSTDRTIPDDVTNDDPILTGKIAWAHLKEFADYHDRLEQWNRRRTRTGSKRRLERGAPSTIPEQTTCQGDRPGTCMCISL